MTRTTKELVDEIRAYISNYLDDSISFCIDEYAESLADVERIKKYFVSAVTRYFDNIIDDRDRENFYGDREED